VRGEGPRLKEIFMSEFRWDPLHGSWVIIDPERGRQPQEFQTGQPDGKTDVRACPFCPEKADSAGQQLLNLARPGQDHWQVRVVPNRTPVLRVEGNLDPRGRGLYDCLNGVGAHEIVIEHRRCAIDFDLFDPEDILLVLQAWQQRLLDLRGDRRLRYMTVVRNVGPASGSRFDHPHSQIIALPMIPPQMSRQLNQAREHYRRKQRCLLCDLIRQERQVQSGILMDEDGYIVFSPWAATRPFALRIVPERHAHDFCLTSENDLGRLAGLLRVLVDRLNRGLNKPSYRLLLVTSPPEQQRPHQTDLFATLPWDWHWYLELSPCLTRETGIEQATGIAVNPVPPEEAVTFLRGLAPC